MANIFLTDKCGRNCSFCFAREGPWDDDYPARALTMDEVRECIDLDWPTPSNQVGLVGGEPLKYPQLTEVMKLMWDRGLYPKVFTSGSCTIPEDLIALKAERNFNFVCNISQWDTYTRWRQKNLDLFLKTFRRKVNLGYTMVDPDEDPSFLLDYVEEYNLYHSIRIGIALPIVGKSNQYMLPERYRDAALRFIDLARKASRKAIALGTDCGFVACMFTPTEIGYLMSLGMSLIFTCRPVIDIGPNLEAWHCFPLSKLPRISLRENRDLQQVEASLRRMADELREKFGPGIYARCKDCTFRRRGQCDGGCLGLMVPAKENLREVSKVHQVSMSGGK
jgi:MoaA/NifB/PqqE/SkfB family radical SAM enzyme